MSRKTYNQFSPNNSTCKKGESSDVTALIYSSMMSTQSSKIKKTPKDNIATARTKASSGNKSSSSKPSKSGSSSLNTSPNIESEEDVYDINMSMNQAQANSINGPIPQENVSQDPSKYWAKPAFRSFFSLYPEGAVVLKRIDECHEANKHAYGSYWSVEEIQQINSGCRLMTFTVNFVCLGYRNALIYHFMCVKNPIVLDETMTEPRKNYFYQHREELIEYILREKHINITKELQEIEKIFADPFLVIPNLTDVSSFDASKISPFLREKAIRAQRKAMKKQAKEMHKIERVQMNTCSTQPQNTTTEEENEPGCTSFFGQEMEKTSREDQIEVGSFSFVIEWPKIENPDRFISFEEEEVSRSLPMFELDERYWN